MRTVTRTGWCSTWLLVAATNACAGAAGIGSGEPADTSNGSGASGAGTSQPNAIAGNQAGTGGAKSAAQAGATAPGSGGKGGAGGNKAGTAGSGAAGSAGSGGKAAETPVGGHGGSGKPVYDAHRDPNAAGILIHVENACPFEIWIHGAGKGAVLDPDNKHFMPGDTQDYTAPDDWSAARVTAYGAAPDAQGHPQQELDKVEMTLGKKVINYNITYVDWLGLPVEMIALGSGTDCKSVGCYIPVADVAQRCPDGLLSGMKCRSAGSYCSAAANQSSSFCHALDEQIAKCAGDAQRYPQCGGAAGATTAQVYGCAGFFSGSPKWCAALNRGMLDDPDNGTISEYYTHAPFNAYSQWVHSVCPGIYAFPYDDYGKTNESGFHACGGGRQLNITFCPAG